MLLNELRNCVCYLMCRFPPVFVYIRKEAAILTAHSRKKYSLHSHSGPTTASVNNSHKWPLNVMFTHEAK